MTEQWAPAAFPRGASQPRLLKVRGAKGHDTWREGTHYAVAATEAELRPLLEKAWARGFDAEITWATDPSGMDEYLDHFYEEYRSLASEPAVRSQGRPLDGGKPGPSQPTTHKPNLGQ